MICSNCTSENRANATFCGSCGNKLSAKNDRHSYAAPLQNVSIFFFAMLLYIAMYQYLNREENYISTITGDIIFLIIVLVFFFLEYKKMRALMRFKRLKWKIIALIIILAPLEAVAVSYVVNIINRDLLDAGEVIYYDEFRDSFSPLFMSILSMAVFPAVTEEIACRGILFNDLRKLTGVWPTIIVTSFVFSILHFSVFSLFWLFPSAILLGYLRYRHNTIMYGIIAHFIYNTSVVLLQLYNN